MPRDADRRESILRAAATAFAERGFAATSMDDVAAEAGISRLIVYRHFNGKEALYEAVLARVSARLREALAVQLGLEDRTGRAAVAATMAAGREDPAAFTLLWRHAAREPRFAEHADQAREKAVEFTAAVLADVLRGGTAAERRWAAETMVTYVIGAVLHWLEDGPAAGDGMVVERVSASLPAMVQAWAAADAGAGADTGADADRTHVRYAAARGRAQMEAG